MASITSTTIRQSKLNIQHSRLLQAIWQHRVMYLMLIPPLLYFIIFRYGSYWYAQIAFKDFSPRLGVVDSPFSGLSNFSAFINSYYFGQLMGNTVAISLLKLVLGLPTGIILALALHETRITILRRMAQTISFLPHVLSWVIVSGILLVILSPSEGLLNRAITTIGATPIPFLTTPVHFRGVVVFSDIWKEMGWSAILYLAALLAINPTLYEAAAVDGASPWQRIWHISLPGMMDVIVLVTLLRLGGILDAGFGQIFNLYSLPVYSVGDILDTWVYRQGILSFQTSLATAAGLFKGVIGLLLIITANHLAKRMAGKGLY
jgi:putative aldouronate transport system permease protein